MREINGNQNNLSFPKVEIKKDVPQSVEITEQEGELKKPVTEDLSLSPEAVIGRSQVQMTDKASVAKNVEADMKAMLENPKAIQKAADFFDIAYARLQENGSEDAYEKAAVLTNAFKEDFLN